MLERLNRVRVSRLAGASLILASLVLAALAAMPAVKAQYADPGIKYVFRVHVTDRANQIPILAEMHLDLAAVNTRNETADFVGGMDVFDGLKAAGFDPVIVWSSTDHPTEALSDYLDPTEVATRFSNYEGLFPSLAKKYQIATTSEGRAVWAMKISDNVALEEDEPVVFFDCQHHAREVMTEEICVDIVDYLLNQYNADPKVKAWVDNHEIWVIGTINPDGSNTVFTSDTSWRKNRRVNGDGSYGVDINRNYPFAWGACGGSSNTPSAEDYRGPSASSEPETTGYVALARTHRPSLAVSYHSSSEFVLHPYGCDNVFTPENRLERDLSSDLAARLVNDAGSGWYEYGTSWELLYAVDGGMKDWFYGEIGASAWTIEVSSDNQGFQPDYATWRNSTVERNRPGWQYVLDRIDGSAVYGHVTNACTGAPLVATVGLDEVVYSNGETPRLTEVNFGRFHWLTTPGLRHLRVSKTGYTTQVWPVDVGTEATLQDVRLVPAGSYTAAISGRTIVDTGGDGDGEVDPGENATMRLTAYATGGALTGLTATISTTDPYVSITDATASWPSIAAGGSAASTDTFGFYVTRTAPDDHVIPFTVTFSANQSLCGASVTLPVRVTRSAKTCPAFDFPLTTNPGWTIQNNTTSGWAFGPPSGTGGTGGPTGAHSGTNVYGTNLAGSYAANADYKLTTLPLDMSLLKNTELRFWRWLNSETGRDLSSIEVSTDGTNFTKIWSGFGIDTGWGEYRYDISSLADGKPTVYVRFRQQSDGSTNQSGFYIDDISICGETVTPAPKIVVTGSSVNDGVKTACTDHDTYADAGEVVDLTVNFKNDGNAAATGLNAVLSTVDPNVRLVTWRSAVGTLAPGAMGSATYRVQVPGSPACLSSAPFNVDFDSNGGNYAARDTSVSVRLQTDNGTSVPDSVDTFETTTLWTLTGEWQIQRPRGKGGAGTTDGYGSPDPPAAYAGIRVLGVDLTGTGTSLGNYENGLSTPITATSPSYDCTNSHNVHLQFKRWLGVEGSLYDHASIEAWDGAAWQVVWSNPLDDLSDTTWQSVDYDVSRYADGNPAFKVRFKMSSNSAKVFCGWNIDDMRLTNGYTQLVCESSSCAAPCAPTTEAGGVTVTRTGSTSAVTWTPTADACQETAGIGYRVYRATDPRPRIVPPAVWPADSYFTDVTAMDADYNLGNLSFTETLTPATGQVFYYLIVPLGTGGAEGPKGWQGF